MSNPMKKFLADAEKEFFRAKDKHPEKCGWTQLQIGRAFNVAQGTVSLNIKKLNNQ